MQIEGSLATDDSAVKPHRCLRQGQVFYPSFLQMVGLYLSLKTHMVHWICQTSQWGGWRVTWVRFEDSTASSPYPCKYAWAKRERTAFSHKRGWFYQDRVLVSEDRRWLLPGFCGESWCELQRSADAGSMLTDQCAIDSCLEKAYTVHPSLQMVCVCVCVCTSSLKEYRCPHKSIQNRAAILKLFLEGETRAMNEKNHNDVRLHGDAHPRLTLVKQCVRCRRMSERIWASNLLPSCCSCCYDHSFI